MRSRLTIIVCALALLIGATIGYVDSRPTWDDTGVTVGCVFLAAAVLSAIRPRVAWIVGLAVGVPVVAFNLILHGNAAAIAALVVALIGAGLGWLIGKAIGIGAEPEHQRS